MGPLPKARVYRVRDLDKSTSTTQFDQGRLTAAARLVEFV